MSPARSRNAVRHLRAADPVLREVIDRIGRCRFELHSSGSHFESIAKAIIYQQLSGKAAGTIHRRFHSLYGDRSPTVEELLRTSNHHLRGVGLSRQKSMYLKDLARRIMSQNLPIERLQEFNDSEVIETLVAVKGIGRWTAQMFLIFRLGRPDVLPDGDLGIQKAIQRAYRLRQLPRPSDVQRLGAKWRPYSTIAAWYLWRTLDAPSGAPPESPL